VTPAGQSASFVVPAGWRHQWGTAPSGESAYLITPPQGQQKGVIAVSMFPLSGQDADRSIRDLLQMGLHGLLAGQPYTVIEGPQEFTVDGKRAGKVIISAQSPQTGGSIEGQLGGLIAEEFAYVLLSMAPPEEAKKMRAGLDTVLATLRVPQTRENEALKSRILGCWTRYEGRTDRDSNHSDSRTYQFAPDGTYSYQGRTTINAAGMSGNSGSAEQGRFRVIGQVLHLFPSEGNPYSAPIQLQGGRLVAQGMAYLPCR
jgi:hypothetical protein